MKASIGILRKARDLITDPAHWTQGESARNQYGEMVYPNSNTAVCWCAAGAISRAAYTEEYSDQCAAERLLNACCAGDFINYNDSHTHAEVLALFDKAIGI